MIREILRMGDPRLWERSTEVARFGTPELAALLTDMRDTMREADGAGLAPGHVLHREVLDNDDLVALGQRGGCLVQRVAAQIASPGVHPPDPRLSAPPAARSEGRI